ncbi:MAG: tyrosine-type recombinase/integrase [Anaerolineaceae bacterium]|nr:tyrosine-type recombinase/integrase [Anaerolineaceae bacterium]
MDTPVTSLKIHVDNTAWGDAITLWLQSRRSDATRRAYAKALEDLLTSTNRLPWEVTRTDVHRWVNEMETRGNAPATVAQRLAAISSFYQFTIEDYYLPGSQTPLHNVNPAAGKALRPNVELYGKAAWLSPDEARSLLRAIYRGTLQGRRDFALFLGYVLLARRNTEWRLARWGNFDRHGDLVFFRWSGKGKSDQRLEVPLPLWNALCEYLRAAGRLGKLKAEDYIFTPLSRQGQVMPNGGTVGEQALSAHEVGRLLKRYLRQAGLDATHIKPHSLRHTGAMLRKAAGASDQEIMEFLGHSNLAITQVYLHMLDGRRDEHWMTVSELLGLELS